MLTREQAYRTAVKKMLWFIIPILLLFGAIKLSIIQKGSIAYKPAVAALGILLGTFLLSYAYTSLRNFKEYLSSPLFTVLLGFRQLPPFSGIIFLASVAILGLLFIAASAYILIKPLM